MTGRGVVSIVFGLVCCCLLVTVHGATTISLQGTAISVSGSGVDVSGTVATITSAGTYTVVGSLKDGQLIVDCDDKDSVEIILNSASITCSTGSALLVNQHDTKITLSAGTSNSLTDGSTYANPDDDPNAALFSKDGLTIAGSGKLIVTGNYADGITSKDELVITGGTITVDSVDDGIRGKDSITISGSPVITIIAGGVALKSDKNESGTVLIQGGTFVVDSTGDAIDAEYSVDITGGAFQFTSKGKGIKAGSVATFSGGVFDILSVDDAIHTSGNLTINDGQFTLTSGDDAIHSDVYLTINGGTIDILSCYEGIESTVITITGGTIHLNSTDDGINAASDTTGESQSLRVTGGYIYVNGQGDGVDINGAITFEAGTLIVDGPTANDNAAIDFDTGFTLDAGYVIGAGSCGMAEPPTAGKQCSILANFNSTLAAKTLFHIQTTSGTHIVTYAPAKTWQSVVFSSSALAVGESYSVYYGGSCTGTPTDGVYPTTSVYTAGTLETTFTLTTSIMKVGAECGGGFPPHSGSGGHPHSGSGAPPPGAADDEEVPIL
ncbi:dockerin type 1 [Pelomyxa schiedti]|nr:dockerin type 1 [Pelomyxa schiedti]